MALDVFDIQDNLKYCFLQISSRLISTQPLYLLHQNIRTIYRLIFMKISYYRSTIWGQAMAWITLSGDVLFPQQFSIRWELGGTNQNITVQANERQNISLPADHNCVH
jgi:hypothetical protein